MNANKNMLTWIVRLKMTLKALSRLRPYAKNTSIFKIFKGYNYIIQRGSNHKTNKNDLRKNLSFLFP